MPGYSLDRMIDDNRESTLLIGSATLLVLLILAALYAKVFGIGFRRRRFGSGRRCRARLARQHPRARPLQHRVAQARPGRTHRAARWSQLPALPAPWEQALAPRWTGAKPPAAAKETQVDEWLLRLETALGVPAAPERQAERQALKLRALKDTLEGRGAVQDGPAQQAAWLQSVLQQRGLDSTRRARLQGLLAALRNAPPGTLGTVGAPR